MNPEPADLQVRHLPVQHLDAAAFSLYGAVIEPETADSPNLNRAPGNLGYLWIQKPLEFPRQPFVGALRFYYRGMRCEFLQKHPASTVFLVPLGGRPSVIYVASESEAGLPALDSARAFLLTGERGVILHRGTWMRYAYPLGPFADYAYVTQRVDAATANTSDDVVRCRLDETFGLVLDIAFQPPPGVEVGRGGFVVSGPPHSPPLE